MSEPALTQQLACVKDKGLLPAVRPLMEAMQSQEFRISDRVFARNLSAAGEL
jgi:predicted nucleic acid-binding protein